MFAHGNQDGAGFAPQNRVIHAAEPGNGGFDDHNCNAFFGFTVLCRSTVAKIC
jgi:hypothetical protein